MEKFEITILGCGCAVPTTRHNPSAQIVNIREKLSLVDCGEGTQLQIRQNKAKFMKIQNIFITHTHGDHCFGLLGLISSFGLLGRIAPLHVFAPETYKELFQAQMDFFCQKLEYDVVFHPVATEEHQLLFEDRSMSVYSIPLKHRVPCCGYLFKEKPTLPHIKRDMIDFYNIPTSEINNIKNGKDWILPDGTIIPNSHLTTPAEPIRSYAYCSDTLYNTSIIPLLEGVTLLYHEATFGNDRKERAKQTFHSTSEQAATIAKKCHANQLLIGHYSAHYPDSTILIKEAQTIFPNTRGAEEGMIINL